MMLPVPLQHIRSAHIKYEEVQPSQRIVDISRTGAEEYLLEILRRYFFILKPFSYLEIDQTINRTEKTKATVGVDLEQLKDQFTHSKNSSHHEQLPLIPSIVKLVSQEEVLTDPAHLQALTNPPFVLKNWLVQLPPYVTSA